MSEENMVEPILKVEDLKVHFHAGGGLFSKKKVVKAVDGVSFEIMPGETFGLVGESGCGKSTTGRAIVKIYNPTSGKIYYKGEDITHIKGKELKDFRQNVQMIFQDPYASLNARMTVRDIIAEPLKAHHVCKSKQEVDEKVFAMLNRVGLTAEHAGRYAHEFSGGQRQRLTIARALVPHPQVLILDDSSSALDFATDAALRKALKEQTHGMTVFIVSQRASAVQRADRILVLDDGNLVGSGTHANLLKTCDVYREICLSQLSREEVEKTL